MLDCHQRRSAPTQSPWPPGQCTGTGWRRGGRLRQWWRRRSGGSSGRGWRHHSLPFPEHILDGLLSWRHLSDLPQSRRCHAPQSKPKQYSLFIRIIQYTNANWEYCNSCFLTNIYNIYIECLRYYCISLSLPVLRMAPWHHWCYYHECNGRQWGCGGLLWSSLHTKGSSLLETLTPPMN